MTETRPGNGHNNWHRWPGARIIKLKELWPDFSASYIGDLMGMTRNAVIGKANRLHLSAKKQNPRSIPKKKPQHTMSASKPIVTAAPERPPAMQPPVSLDLTIYQVGTNQCRYPHGDASPFLFCGGPTEGVSPYCAFHHRLCNYAVTPYRRDLSSDLTLWRGVR